MKAILVALIMSAATLALVGDELMNKNNAGLPVEDGDRNEESK